MTKQGELRLALITHCTEFIENQLSHVHEAIAVAKNAAKEESKSSAGDKHETGKSHLQLTQENNSKHLANLQQQKRVIKLLENYVPDGTVKLGSLVQTTNGYYFIALGVGQVKVLNETVFVVSPVSPVGKVMLNKQQGDQAQFNALKFTINSIE
jgi:transcription elongation GreA/GreB family factor